MTDLTPQEEKDFLKELNSLSRKAKIIISGCGCCGSPFLMKIKERELHPDAHYIHKEGSFCDLQWIYPASYEWDELKEKSPEYFKERNKNEN